MHPAAAGEFPPQGSVHGAARTDRRPAFPHQARPSLHFGGGTFRPAVRDAADHVRIHRRTAGVGRAARTRRADPTQPRWRRADSATPAPTWAGLPISRARSHAFLKRSAFTANEGVPVPQVHRRRHHGGQVCPERCRPRARLDVVPFSKSKARQELPRIQQFMIVP